MTGVPPRRGFDWDAAGRALGESLDGYHALVVAGTDPVATGRVAVSLARAQATKRRVAVGDLFAESPPIQALVSNDDPHGLVDSFLYGVSISRIAHEVPDAGQLFVMPSGTEAPNYEELLPNPRWQRLAAGFREVGALLILAVPASAPHIDELVSATDGVILVGEGLTSVFHAATVIASVREPRLSEAVQPLGNFIVLAPPRPSRSRTKRIRLAALAGLALTLGLAAIALWLADRPLANPGPARVGRKPDTAKGLSAVIPAVEPDTALRSSSSDTGTTAVTTITNPRITNPADSAQAAAFSVVLMAANTQLAAILKLQQDGKNLPAATFAPVLDGRGARWFRVIGGAYANRTEAESLRASLRQRKILDADRGDVVQLPFAFLIESGIRPTAVRGMVAMYGDRGLPVYALGQEDGTAWLLAGAFETLDQSSLYAESLRASGITPVLVYRKGRTF